MFAYTIPNLSNPNSYLAYLAKILKIIIPSPNFVILKFDESTLIFNQNEVLNFYSFFKSFLEFIDHFQGAFMNLTAASGSKLLFNIQVAPELWSPFVCELFLWSTQTYFTILTWC